MPDGPRLTQNQIALVLQRAAELDRDLGPIGPAGGLGAAAVEEAAMEAGLSRVAVRRALAELQAGLLETPVHKPRGLLGPATFEMSRTVPGPAGRVERQLHAFLKDQLFEMRRDRGLRTTWIRRRGLEATTRRAVDRAVQRQLILREVNHLDVSLLDEEDWVLVRLEVDVLAVRHAQGKVTGAATVAGAGMAMGTAAAAGLHPVFVLTATAGLGMAGAGHWMGTRLYRRRVGELEAGLAGVLDRLERGERREPSELGEMGERSHRRPHVV